MATPQQAIEMARTIRDLATRSIAFSREHGTQDGRDARVTLRIDRPCKGERVRLFGKFGGPLGRIVSNEGRGVIAMFDAHEILTAADVMERDATALANARAAAD